MKPIILAAMLLLCLPVFAQDDIAKPDRWRGLVIDEATVDDAERILGKPNSDKVDRALVYNVDRKWISKKQEEKIFRRLEYKKLDGFKKVELTFLDSTLALINLEPTKEIEAAAISRIYSIPFYPKVSGFQEAMFPRDYERNEGRVYPKTYPSVYHLIAVTERVFVGVLVGNIGFGAALRSTVGVRDSGDFPGKTNFIQIISRRLENKDGSDLLK